MENIIESIHYSKWTELVKDLEKNDDESKIYRGHSNEYQKRLKKKLGKAFLNADFSVNINTQLWSLISSFDRYYQGGFYKFGTFLCQQLENNNFKSRYGKHNFIEIFYLKDCSQLERIYYLQHYGVPTCFIDFSHNPLIALFFAIAHVRATNVYTPDLNGNPIIHPPEAYISLYELNHKRISELLNIKYIDNEFSDRTYGKYKVKFGHLAFDISPIEKCQLNTLNENLKLQKGCFVLYDNEGSSCSLDKRIGELLLYDNKEKEILIKEYRLHYNEIFRKYSFEGLTKVTLYDYLEKNHISGRTLFNDIQGLKYDLNFFHH